MYDNAILANKIQNIKLIQTYKIIFRRNCFFLLLRWQGDYRIRILKSLKVMTELKLALPLYFQLLSSTEKHVIQRVPKQCAL